MRRTKALARLRQRFNGNYSKSPVKRIYVTSVKELKGHPYRYLAIVSLGLGLLSGLIILNNKK